MSFEAVRWALEQDVGRSSAKFALVVMAWHVPEGSAEMLSPASYGDIAKHTHMDPKTVLECVDRLRTSGLISATEQRAGITNKVVVHRLNYTKNGSVSSGPEGEGGDKLQHANAPKNGGIKPNENTPVFPSNPPKFPVESPQISGNIPPKTDALSSVVPTSLNTNTSSKEVKKGKGKRFGEGDAARPDDVTDQTWKDWTTLRRKKRANASVTALDGAREEAAKANLTLEQFLRLWCLRGTQGLMADWIKPAERIAASRHIGFSEKKYREGVESDGSFH